MQNQATKISRRKFLKKGGQFLGFGTLLRLFPWINLIKFDDYLSWIRFKLLNKIDLVWNKFINRLIKNR